MCSGIIIFVLLWCNREKGPVFVTIFNPLSTIMVAFTAYFVLGEKLYMGRWVRRFVQILEALQTHMPMPCFYRF